MSDFKKQEELISQAYSDDDRFIQEDIQTLQSGGKIITPSFTEIAKLISKYAFTYQNEKDLQDGIENVLILGKIKYIREFKMTARERIDFYLPDTKTGIEIKTKGAETQIIRQLLRYSQLDLINELILITTKSAYPPGTLNKKPCNSIYINSL